MVENGRSRSSFAIEYLLRLRDSPHSLVWLPGVVRKLNQLRRKAMVTVICSRYETFSSATLEAMTMGCPTVAARVGGILEIVHDQDNGLLHRPEDPADLAAKILTLLNDPGRAAQAGRRAADHCEQQFHPNVIAGRFAEYFNQVIQHWRLKK